MARAQWAWQRPEQTARALLDAYRASPGEVRDRPAIRRTRAPAAYAELHAAGTRSI
jgi:hypothetical protein